MKRVLLAKPNWPSDHSHYDYFWGELYDILKAEFSASVDVLNVPYGAGGVAKFVEYYGAHKGKYDLSIPHHTRFNRPDMVDFKPSYYNHLWYLDCGGYSGYSNMTGTDFIDRDVSIDEVDRHYRMHVEPLITRTKYGTKNNTPLEDWVPEKFIFVATQVEMDTVMKLKSIPTITMIERAYATAKTLGVPLVVKQHPMVQRSGSTTRYVRDLYRRNGDAFETKGDIRTLLDRSVATCVINSGVGFENMIRLKPTFIFGKSDYSGGVSVDCAPSDMVKVIRAGVDADHVKRFIYSWWKKIIDVDSFEHRMRMIDIIRGKL